jgi:serine/threonine-protein kinase
MPLSPGDKLGPYEILAALGAGGMGEVYRARDSRLGREVAVKVLPGHLADPQSMRRFDHEAKAVAALAHPNILVLYDVGEYEGTRYAVTELLEGETLRDRLSRGSFNWRNAAEVGAAIAQGLSAAHSKDIVHRDIKPDNIFLTDAGCVKILDFGLARRQPNPTEQDRTVTETEAGKVMGTVGYMSPEQVRGEKAGAPSDLFSLGVVLYEMVAGRRPFSGNSAAETMSAVLTEDPPAIADSVETAPVELERVIQRCLAKSPAQRFQSAHDLAFVLKGLTSGDHAVRVSTRRSLAWVTVAVLAFLAAAAIFYYWHDHASTRIDSLAVLPFVNASTTPDGDYLSDGITESLIGSLSQLPNLKVMSHSAVFRYKGKATDPRTVGRDLGVQTVLTGRVTQRADSLSVSAELVKVDDNTALWGEQYNSRLMDALAVQNDIAHQIVEKLKLRLSSQQIRQMAKPQTTSPEAYQLYLKGRYYASKFDPENLNRGREYLRQAIAIDPNFALAYDGLSYYYALLIDWYEPANEAGPKALGTAHRALELDPNLVEAHVELASAHLFYDFDWPAAEREFKRALELNPNYAPAHEYYAWYLIDMGRSAESLAEARKAEQLDPLSAEDVYVAGWFLQFSGRYADSVAEIDKCLELDPNLWIAYYIQGQAYEQLGRFPQALAVLKKSQRIFDSNPSLPLAEEARVYALSSRRSDALRTLDRLLALSKRMQVSKYPIATVYAALRDKGQAFVYLNRAYDEHSFMLGFLKVDPALDPLRSNPRFQDLLQRMKLQ